MWQQVITKGKTHGQLVLIHTEIMSAYLQDNYNCKFCREFKSAYILQHFQKDRNVIIYEISTVIGNDTETRSPWNLPYLR